MKSKMKHFKISAFLIVCVMLVATLSSLTVGATGDRIHTLSNGIITVEHTIAGEAFPTRDLVPEDCLFAGWYADSGCVKPVASAKEISEGTVYAKYVPKKVLSIKAQVIDTLTNDSVDDDAFAKVRFVSSVDDLHYKQIGFKISYTKVGAENETTLPLESTSFKKVYTQLYYVGSNEEVMAVTPNEEFHETASNYFVACTIKNIDPDNYETYFRVTPYWVTLDGEEIEGVTRSVTVADGCVREEAWVDATGTDACNYGSSAHPYKTLEYAVSKANSVTWKENQSPTVTVTSDLDIANTIQFTKPLTITSDKAVTLNRKTGNNNMFRIPSGSNVDVKIIGATDAMITIDGGTAQGNATGARIGFFENGKITLENAIVTNSYVNGGGAGAIYFSKELVCNNVIFRNNGAITNGGAVQNAGKGQYTNVTFESNSTSASDQNINGGGAVHIGSAGTATFTGCKLNQNTSTKYGGAIYNEGTLNIDDSSEFVSNKSANQGGAIYTTKAITLNDCTFTSNQSTNEGGAIFITSSGVVEVNDNCVFNGNKSTAKNGGAICNLGTLTVTETNKFVSNTATGKGGAIANYNKLTMSGDCEFVSNKSTFGGAIYASSGKVTINGKIVFKENEITTGGTHGGAIFNDGSSEMKLLGESIFDSNKSVIHGGAICNTSTLEIAGSSEFVSNESAERGGAIYTTKTITLTGCKFTSNKSTREGGAIFNQGTLNVVDGCKFSENQSKSNGGAMCNTGTLKVAGTNEFTSNTAGQFGGAIGNYGGLELDGENTFTSNTAASHGGVIFNGSGTLTIKGQNNFNGNIAKNHGGAICNTATINLQGNGTFDSNQATNDGGAIHNAGTLNMSECRYTFSGNTAGVKGGAIRTDKAITVNNCTFTGNTAPSGSNITIKEGVALTKENNIGLDDSTIATHK